MPARVNRRSRSLDAQIGRAYTAATIREISERHNFDGSDPQWRHAITSAARRYLSVKGRQELAEASLPKDKFRAMLSKKVQRAIETLIDALDDEDHVLVGLEMIGLAKKMRVHLPERPGLENAVALLPEMRNGLRLLSAALRDMKGSNRTPKRGPKRDLALIRFIDYLRDFWVGRLGRKFTLDYHQGAGVNKAFYFFKDAIRPIADVSDTRLVTAMRFVIADHPSAHRVRRKKRH